VSVFTVCVSPSVCLCLSVCVSLSLWCVCLYVYGYIRSQSYNNQDPIYIYIVDKPNEYAGLPNSFEGAQSVVKVNIAKFTGMKYADADTLFALSLADQNPSTIRLAFPEFTHKWRLFLAPRYLNFATVVIGLFTICYGGMNLANSYHRINKISCLERREKLLSHEVTALRTQTKLNPNQQSISELYHHLTKQSVSPLPLLSLVSQNISGMIATNITWKKTSSETALTLALHPIKTSLSPQVFSMHLKSFLSSLKRKMPKARIELVKIPFGSTDNHFLSSTKETHNSKTPQQWLVIIRIPAW